MCGRNFVRRIGSALLILGATWAGGCASAPDQVRDIAARRLHCPYRELAVALNRETRSVREYAVGCNFMYTLVHCTDQGCTPAEAEPPCVGNLPCFEENPETLTWQLAATDSPAPARK